MGKIEFLETEYSTNMLKGIFNPFFSKWFFSKFKDFTPAQKFSIGTIHSRENILISSPTGSGKTLGAFGAVLNELLDSEIKGILEDKIYAVYVSPLKALTRDISLNLIEPLQEIETILNRKVGIRIGVRTGDTTQSEKAKMSKYTPHILVTTPESLAIMLSSPKFREKFRNVDWCIVDEIHSLAENKRGTHLSLTLEKLQYLSPGMCRVGLSATVSPIDEVAKFLVGNRDCKIVDVKFEKDLDFKVMSPVPDLVNVSYETISKKTYELMDKLIHSHKTTLIFTNTRSATERIVHHLRESFPDKYTEITDDDQVASLIGAHHGSLSKSHRLKIENALRDGKLKCCVCSTSLELGIDIGYIDLVVCLGSPKSVARALQRIGRAGHKLHSTIKGRIVVLDRDDLVECACLLKNAIEKKIDRVHIPMNCLDVLAQQIYGMAIDQVWNEKEMFEVIKNAYPYSNLSYDDFNDVLDYLSGEFISLESRYVYAKIWRENGEIGKRGKLSRVIYMTNIGTIPDETFISVKIGDEVVGRLDESFLERLGSGDKFVLGGETYKFKHARGMVAQVQSAHGQKPTIPSWFSEMLPLSFDLASEIQKFRYLMEEYFVAKTLKKDVLNFIHNYLYVDENASKAICAYFKEQYDYLAIPNKNKLLIEHYKNEEGRTFHVVHSLYGRRVNDALCRAIAYVISQLQKRDVEVGISDNGFYLSSSKPINIVKAIEILQNSDFNEIVENAIDKTELLKRRFRHCATRSLMILRNYKGKKKRVGRQQVSSMLLLKAVRDLSPNFSILKEAKREVLEDLMDVKNAYKVLLNFENMEIVEKNTLIPGPFAFNLVLQGMSDIMKGEERQEFLKRMHNMVLAKISLNK